MPDWRRSMQQTFEYYIVDADTWRDKTKLDKVISSTINRDKTADTLGSASFDVTDSLGESYVRTYLITLQDGKQDKIALGTHLVQTPTSKFDGKIRSVTLDGYTPLLELKDDRPPLGYFLKKGTNIMDAAFDLIDEHCRAPIVKTDSNETLHDDFVANVDDTWLSYIKDLVRKAKYDLDVDEMGRILFLPIQDTASLRPVYTYDDGNSSILYPEVTMQHDIFGIPNVVTVIYSDANSNYTAEAINDDENSPTSIVNRGRIIRYRVTNPSFSGVPSEEMVQRHADDLLREMSSVEYELSYTHGYCPVRTDDCVLLDYRNAQINDVKARVVNQTIKCEPGCPVTETAVYSVKLWG